MNDLKRDYRKIIKVIDSCETKEQITVSLKMVMNFGDFYRHFFDRMSFKERQNILDRIDELWKYALERETGFDYVE